METEPQPMQKDDKAHAVAQANVGAQAAAVEVAEGVFLQTPEQQPKPQRIPTGDTGRAIQRAKTGEERVGAAAAVTVAAAAAQVLNEESITHLPHPPVGNHQGSSQGAKQQQKELGEVVIVATAKPKGQVPTQKEVHT